MRFLAGAVTAFLMSATVTAACPKGSHAGSGISSESRCLPDHEAFDKGYVAFGHVFFENGRWSAALSCGHGGGGSCNPQSGMCPNLDFPEDIAYGTTLEDLWREIESM